MRSKNVMLFFLASIFLLFSCYSKANNELYTKTNGLGSSTVYGVVVDKDGTIYAATQEGLSISTNGGKDFTTKTTDDGLGHNWINKVYVANKNDHTILACTLSGLSFSIDKGKTFKTVEGKTHKVKSNALMAEDNDIRNFKINGLCIGETLYLATSNGLIIFHNKGKTLCRITTDNGLLQNNIISVHINDSKIYAVTEQGISVSTNGGFSFTTFTKNFGYVNEACVNNNGKIYVATYTGLHVIDGDKCVIKTSKDSDQFLSGLEVSKKVFVFNKTVFVPTYCGLDISYDGGNSFTNQKYFKSNIIYDICAYKDKFYMATYHGLLVFAMKDLFKNEEKN